jgi:hypothetical protein
VKPQVWTTFSGDRRYFIGGSDARIIMGNDEDALLRLRFSSMPLSAGRGQARRGWHGCLPAFSCCYACCFGLGDDRPPLPAALDPRRGEGTTDRRKMWESCRGWPRRLKRDSARPIRINRDCRALYANGDQRMAHEPGTSSQRKS